MSNGIPRTLAALRKEVAELRVDASVAAEAQAQTLHKLDQILSLLSGPSRRGKVRDAARELFELGIERDRRRR